MQYNVVAAHRCMINRSFGIEDLLRTVVLRVSETRGIADPAAL